MQPYLVSIAPLTGQSSQRGWLRAGLLAGAVMLATVLPSSAVPLLPGGSVPLAGGSSGPGVVIRDTLLAFEIRNGARQVIFSGNIQDRVVRLASTGDLSFEPWLRDLTVGPAGAGFYILGLKFTGYDDTTTDVGFDSSSSGTISPSNASRDISGDEVTFQYASGALVPPFVSRSCYTATNAPAYHLAGVITITARNATFPFVQTYSTTITGTAAPTRLQVYPGGFIQPAINAAAVGETVVVHAGTYPEALTLRSGINVKGDNAGSVILKPPSGPGVLINACANTEFSGFTVMPGAGSTATVGIQVNGGSPLVKNNIVSGFTDGMRLLSGTTALVCGNRVQNNGNSGNGLLDYGILSLNSKPLISNNLITGNECGCYIGWHDSDGAQFINNTVVNNLDEGLWCYQSNPVVKNNILTGNTSGISASHDNATPVLTYNDSWGNSWRDYDAQATGVITIGTGSLSVDPLFDPASPGNYNLVTTSPCRNAGDPAAIYNDLDGSRNDMGWTGGPCASPMSSAAPFGGFLFTTVGNIPVNYIDGSGFATVPGPDATALQIYPWDVAPFGGADWMFGVFGSGVNSDVAYYTIECRSHGEPEAAFAPLDHQLSKVKFTIGPSGITTTVEAVGPLWISGTPYYSNTINGGNIYWANDTLRFILNSPQLTDGNYDFRLKAFNWDYMPVALTGLGNSLTLMINNKAPKVEILSIAREDGNLVSECGVVSLTGPQENLGFKITASHADGYLESYTLDALVGRNRGAGTIASDTYVPLHTGSVLWPGVTGSVFHSLPAMMASSLAQWESCAYQFRLSAWARTTNGYDRLYYREFFWNLALNGSPADFNGDGVVDGEDLNIFARFYGTSSTLLSR
ncbi:MAG: right-handed parallel beta-helix repeat-containing protein [Verrucomicrobia bacterium]|nr:right-handed parallel beta-helix repeat-containing protein [Verrucomicrobiota bacterium]